MIDHEMSSVRRGLVLQHLLIDLETEDATQFVTQIDYHMASVHSF